MIGFTPIPFCREIIHVARAIEQHRFILLDRFQRRDCVIEELLKTEQFHPYTHHVLEAVIKYGSNKYVLDYLSHLHIHENNRVYVFMAAVMLFKCYSAEQIARKFGELFFRQLGIPAPDAKALVDGRTAPGEVRFFMQPQTDRQTKQDVVLN